MNKNISGTHVYEYFKCKRQLHLNLENITFYENSDNITMGKILEKETYKRRSKKFKQFNIGVGVVDFIDFRDKIIYETKKSTSMLELGIYQLKFYMMSMGEGWSGVIEVPKERYKEKFTLNDNDKKELNEAISYIKNIKPSDKVPERLDSPICKKCSFYDYCYV